MSHRLLRSVAATAVVAASLIGALAAPATAQTDPSKTGPPETPSGDPAIDDLVSCIQGSRRLIVLFLIDESASLKQSDPDNRRVDAARGALDSLVAMADAEGDQSPKVDVAFAAFSNDFRSVKGWTEVSGDSAGDLNDTLDEFAEFNDGKDTDFVNALSAGRESLADRAAEITADRGAPPCRAVMLFTDGGYDIGVRTTAEERKRLGIDKPYAPGLELTNKKNVELVELLGRKELCDPGKLADQLRADNITMLTVALSGNVARRAQVPLAAATTGIADDYPCGTQPKKGQETRPQGAYLPAKDIDVLVSQFNGVGTRLAGGNLVPGDDEVEICGDDPCDEGTRTFSLDRTLRRAQILSLAPAPGTEVELTGPTGERIRVSKAGTTQLGATKVRSRAIAGRGLAIDLDRPTDLESWDGVWKASIVDPDGEQVGKSATLQIYVFSDIGVTFGDFGSLRRGTATKVVAQLVLPPDVKPADVVKATTAQARFRDPVTGSITSVDLIGPPEGPFTGTFDTPATTTANALVGTVEVRITTVSNTVLVSQSAPTEFPVQRPEGSIQFAPGSLKMASITGSGSTEADLVLAGGSADGCVWFDEPVINDEPEEAGIIVVTQGGAPLPGEDACIPVAAGKTVTLQITAAPEHRASGTVQGGLVAYEKVEGAKAASKTDIVFRFDMARGIDEGQRLLLATVFLIGGLALPLVLLLIINALSARFQQLDAVRGAALPVRVRGRTISRTDGSYDRPFTLRDDDFGSLASAGNDRRFQFGGVEFRARASRNPFGAMRAMAEPVGGAEKLKGHAGSQVELDAGLAGSWVFLLNPDKTRTAARGDAEGLLIVFVTEGDIEPQTSRILPDISGRLPETAASLAGLVLSSKRKPKKGSKGADAPDAAPDDAGERPTATESDRADAPAPAPPAAASPAPEPDEEPATSEPVDPTAAPAGFGGVAAVDPRRSDVEPQDDDPAPPPVGFGGLGSGT